MLFMMLRDSFFFLVLPCRPSGANWQDGSDSLFKSLLWTLQGCGDSSYLLWLVCFAREATLGLMIPNPLS